MTYRTDEIPEFQATMARAAVGTMGKTGNKLADGVLSGYGWMGGELEYAFPTNKGSYQYGPEKNKGFSPVNEKIRDAVREVLDQNFGNKANDGFSLEGFTNLDVSKGSNKSAEIRVAESSAANPTAYAYYPDRGPIGGDVWFGKAGVYDNPKAGNYGYHTVIHELGHALGLKHAHKAESFDLIKTTLNGKYDSLEYSVMTYHSHPGQKGTPGYTNESFGFPQSFMMADILALQYMYGADYTTNSGDTVYSWKPNSGKTMVDGAAGITPGSNRIFATIWDGGGNDTYDLSAYRNGVTIDLRPGESSTFSKTQLANLDTRNGRDAGGNIYNALLFQGDERSLIENAIGGRGNDKIQGNAADNILTGGKGNDTFFFRTGMGDDVITDFGGKDKINLKGMGLDFADIQAAATNNGADAVIDFGNGDVLTLLGHLVEDLVARDFIL